MPRIPLRVLVLLAALALGATWPGDSWEAWLRPVGFGRGHDPLHLLCLVGGFGLALFVRLHAPIRRDAVATLAVLLALALLTLAARGALLLYLVVLVLSLAGRTVPRELGSARGARVAAATLGLGLALLVAVRFRPAPDAPSPPSTAEASLRALEEGNRHRALYYGRRWRAEEGEPPGHATVFLARVARALEDDVAAVRLAEEAATRGRSDEVRSAARLLLEAWR